MIHGGAPERAADDRHGDHHGERGGDDPGVGKAIALSYAYATAIMSTPLMTAPTATTRGRKVELNAATSRPSAGSATSIDTPECRWATSQPPAAHSSANTHAAASSALGAAQAGQRRHRHDEHGRPTVGGAGIHGPKSGTAASTAASAQG